jgi:alkanesulfonate monooxygenase SsuD/methylene tetrahydromethanopterin reductase-like flavin-dependent oxidoreductase (luciferase family)
MKFGTFSVVDHYPTELPRTVGELYEQLLKQCELAEHLGLDSFWVAEHHFHQYGVVASPPVWLAAAAARTRRIRLGSAISVLPFHNPLLVAEEYAMLDVLSGGRLNFGVGSGYLKHEFEAFRVPFEEKYARFDEALEIIREAWTGKRFSYRGKFFEVNDVALQITPVQKPHPPLLLAILRSEAAAQIGQRGLSVMSIAYANPSLDAIFGLVRNFKEAYRSAGHSGEPEIVCAMHTYVGETDSAADAEARPAMDLYNRTRLYPGVKSRSYDILKQEGLIAVGNPSAVIDTVRQYQEAGFNKFLALMDFGGLNFDQVAGSMRRFCEKVVPAFE